MKTIDLEKFRTPGSKVFTGRDRGLEVRNQSKIDEIESISDDAITIIIPKDIRSINPSFLEEFLFKVVKKQERRTFIGDLSFRMKVRDIRVLIVILKKLLKAS